MMESLLMVLLKIKRVVEDPNALPGEREAAMGKLNLLCEKHGLSLADLVSEEKKVAFYSYRNKEEEDLIAQIAFCVLGKNEVGMWRGDRPKSIGLKLTRAELVEMSAMVDAFLPAFRKEKKAMSKRFAHAFFQRNELFAPSSDDGGEERECSLSSEEIGKILDLASSMDKTAVPRKQIGVAGF